MRCTYLVNCSFEEVYHILYRKQSRRNHIPDDPPLYHLDEKSKYDHKEI